MEYHNLEEIAEAIDQHDEIDYNAVRDFFGRTHIHPDTLVAYPGLLPSNYPTTLMDLACSKGNVKMAKTLLELGSDPHFDYDDGTVTPYWELLYSDSENRDFVNTPKLEILKLFLAYGFDADNLMDEHNDESLFQYVRFSFYEDPDAHKGEVLAILDSHHKK